MITRYNNNNTKIYNAHM